MTRLWEPGTQYNYDDVVIFEGVRYKIIQPHRSQSDWTPPVTPALWGRMQGGDYCGDEKPHPEPYQQQQPFDQHPYDSPYQTNSGPPPEHRPPLGEHSKSWLQEHKTGVEVGGLVAGLAVAGAGLYAYKQHEKREEQKRFGGREQWIQEARLRTEQFHREGPRGPTTWVLVEGRNIPQYAIPGGEENGEPLFICRAFHEGGVQVGKASQRFQRGGVVGYAHNEIQVDTYEVLIGNRQGVRWVDFHGKLKLEKLGARPVEGGHEANGVPLYIAQAHHHNSIHPGKISEKLDGAFIPYGGTEKKISDYRVLCYV